MRFGRTSDKIDGFQKILERFHIDINQSISHARIHGTKIVTILILFRLHIRVVERVINLHPVLLELLGYFLAIYG
jgi:hypothetical protein